MAVDVVARNLAVTLPKAAHGTAVVSVRPDELVARKPFEE
jgi:hypothetical protein